MSTVEFNDTLMGLETYLRSFAMTFTRNMEDAKDLTQETMLKALFYRDHYTPQTNFRAWVFTIMRNIFINQYRRKVKSGTIFDPTAELLLLSNAASPARSTDDYLLGKELERHINGLPKDFRQPFEMHHAGFKYKEIADTLNIPIGTVKSRIFVARKKLMDALPEYAYLNN